MGRGAAAIAVILVGLLSGAPTTAGVGPPSVVLVTFVDAAPSPEPTGTGGPPRSGEGKPGWVWWAAAGLVVMLGAGGVRVWLARREAGGHWDRSAP
jgi:hypothetical protein